MLGLCYAISEFSWYSFIHGYQFKVFLLMLMIGTRSESLKEATGIKIGAWIDLETRFQFWVFYEKFQYAMELWGAACSLVQALGLCSSTCMERFRSRKLDKIQCIDDFTYLILENLFWIFFHVIWFNHDQILSKLAIINQARNIDLGMCIKRFF